MQIGVDICQEVPARTRRSSTPSRPTTATWSPRPPWPSSSWPPMPSPLPAPVPAARTWRATSSVWKRWKPSATASRASRSSYAIQAGREVRIMVKPDEVSDDQIDPAGTRCRQKDRERAGLPRPDQGQRHPRKPRYRVRKIISAACRLPVGCFFIIRPPLGGGLFHISILHISPLRFIINKNTVIRRGAPRRRKTCRKTHIKKFWASWVGWGLPPAATCTRC